MDRFYLENAALYEELISSLDTTTPAPHFSRHHAASLTEEVVVKEECNPDMIVAARIRPMLDDDAGFPCAVYPRATPEDGPQIVDLRDLYNHPRGRPILKSSKHQVDMLFDSTASTEEIYLELVSGLIPFVRHGGIGTLFAYGQTGSGKTFTISQLQRLVASSLMEEGERDKQVYMTIFDLAGNSAFDLLNSRSPFQVLEDSSGTTRLAGATEHQVVSKNDMLDLIDTAAAYRRTASTVKNDASSRSHSICRIRMRDLSRPKADDGMFYLVDLAGSEAARDVAQHGADRMRETREINMSLSVLKDCVRGKAESDALKMKGSRARQKTIRVPIRQSTLTRCLKHVFDPQGEHACRTVVIACVNPSLADVGPSKNTLTYAQMLRAPLTAAMS